MRGIFSAGVLDVFLERGYDPFDLYIGASAGACNIASHLAGQHRRNFRVLLEVMTRPQFISTWKFLRGGNLVDLDYLWDALAKEIPLAVEDIFRSPGRKFVVVTTSVDTGEALYLAPTAADCAECLKASSAMPLLYRSRLAPGSVPMVDGGVADPIPALEAYRRGARRIVVIRTRPASYTKTPGLENRMASFATRRWPRLAQAVLRQADTYRRCVEFMLNPPPDAEVIQIAPDSPLSTGRMTQDKDRLLADYALGRKHAEEYLRSPIAA